MPKFANDMPTMESVFKQHPRPEVKQGLIRDYRLKAIEVLQQGMPDTILRLQALVAKEDDPSSALWAGHVEQGPYLARNVQIDLRRGFATRKLLAKSGDTPPEEDVSADADADANGAHDHEVDDAGSDGGECDDSKFLSETNRDKRGLGAGEMGLGGGIKPGTSYPFAVAKNEVQAEVIKIVVGEAEKLYSQLNTLRIWLSLETPVIEDGNSFGADVQSHLVEQVNKYFQRVGGYINGCNRHYHDRMNIVRQWVQMPNMPDCPANIAASDRMDHVLARQYLRHMLLACGSLLVDFEKNWEKVINPKGREQGSGAMY